MGVLTWAASLSASIMISLSEILNIFYRAYNNVGYHHFMVTIITLIYKILYYCISQFMIDIFGVSITYEESCDQI